MWPESPRDCGAVASQAHRSLQAVELPALSDPELWTHTEHAMANSQYAGGEKNKTKPRRDPRSAMSPFGFLQR